MLSEFKEHIESNFSFIKGKKLLIACSGGLDSVVLANLLYNLNFDISLAHCNFSLRGKESDEDETFVIELAKRLGVEVYTESFDTDSYVKRNKCSTQMAARELRYDWFEDLLSEFNYDYLMTAHHADDDMETFFINMSRGTGLKGLCGIPSENKQLLRPLLKFERTDILNYAEENSIPWREDSSNSKTFYIRNKLRIEVLPAYKGINENSIQNFQKTQNHLQDSARIISDYMALIQSLIVSETESGYSIDINQLNELPNKDALIYELFAPYGFTDLQAIQNLLSAQSGKQIVSDSHRLLKNRDVLLLNELSEESSNNSILISESVKGISEPIKLTFEMVDHLTETSDSAIIHVDKKKLEYPLLIRKWQNGDVFQPFGMKGKKKLSKFFKDEKLSLVAKEKIWVLCSNQHIVWVIGLRLDDNYKVNPDSSEILKIALIS